jgi:hypothetical protein
MSMAFLDLRTILHLKVMVNNILELPIEIRTTIFEHVFRGAKVKYHPRLYRGRQARLSERYLQLLATATATLFTCHRLYDEARPVFLRNARIDLTWMFGGHVRHSHMWIKARTCHLVRDLRLSRRRDKLPDEIGELIAALPRLKYFEFDVIGDLRVTWSQRVPDLGAKLLSFKASYGLTEPVMEQFSRHFRNNMRPFYAALEVWEARARDFSFTAAFEAKCVFSGWPQILWVSLSDRGVDREIS